ncbi:PH, RCC1 and FYVE domains-containing protein 1 [Trichoplusia ni]|uniref:PH, RCC1 and FYVE domains-containing protein 1 n=1 Tax=Trichoplusia ni TaxID=7111 RepID=A0A7E5VE01_TRINI|nr:PH, RCC1 and FYVE domains-containing protein 1 [Trichoplusia ni]
MIYYISGSNIFGQWLCDDIVLSGFRIFSPSKEYLDLSLCANKVVQINWSYNILENNGTYYISGAWGGKEQQLIKIPLPTEHTTAEKDEIIVIGNDYKVVMISKNLNSIWVFDLSKELDFKRINLNVEAPLEHSIKKQKLDKRITKAVVANESCLYLTSEGSVYSGMLPSYVDTRHCKGKICDIQCGYEHYVLLTDEGKVYTWGNGRRLQLGHGDISNQDIPTEVDALAGVTIIKISANGWHTLALSICGDVYAWGWNDTGQLGIKHLDKECKESYSVPKLLDLFDVNGKEVIKNIKDISCGSRHSAILLEDNTVWTTGCNKYGQLGFSEEKYPTVNYFKKAFQCYGDCSLMCGPWNTVIISN